MEYSNLEMMAIAGARLLQNGEVVLVGTGLPLVSTLLAKHTHGPDMVVLMESGLYDSKPQALPFCVADPRGSYRTPWIGTAVELMGQFLQNKKVDVGFLGGAQVDKYGSINSTAIGPYLRPDKRFEGSGGACDIAVLALRTIIIMAHERKRFVEKVDYITSPGWSVKNYPDGRLISREEAGLWGGPDAVVSTFGVMKFDERTREMYVDTFYADLGVTLADIKDNTGFDLDTSRARPALPPTGAELEVLRRTVDPEGIFMKY
ncbi:MAG: acyl CoA--acetate/3-ketoacid CoA transferase subunit beta [Firmicutes bacterium]|nr:acyl CoA--acetate/3-ketoacid CoA transferase subunit beta [Bacillota bacterium]